jgi:hypothetical protein
MLNSKNRITGLFVIIILMFLAGCIGGTNTEGPKRIDEMTSKEKATWFMGVYNAQDKDYRNVVARPNLTNDQKEILRKKKEIMIQVYPMIKAYGIYVDSGAIPTKATEDQIIYLINDLTMLVI